MGICLSVQSLTVPEPDVKAQILEEAQQFVEEDFDWWCEPLYLLGNPGDGEPLCGFPKVVLPGYGWANATESHFVEVDQAEGMFMTARDILYMARKLAEWSQQFGVDWELQLEGDQVGRIINGRISSSVDAYLRKLTDMLGIHLDDPLAQAKADEISQKYSDR